MFLNFLKGFGSFFAFGFLRAVQAQDYEEALQDMMENGGFASRGTTETDVLGEQKRPCRHGPPGAEVNRRADTRAGRQVPRPNEIESVVYLTRRCTIDLGRKKDGWMDGWMDGGREGGREECSCDPILVLLSKCSTLHTLIDPHI